MMLDFVKAQLTYERGRTMLTSVAIAGAVALILLLEGFQTGLLFQLRDVALNRGADLIVAQAGVSNFVGTRSLLPQLSRRRIEAIEGVEEAHPITMVPVIYQREGYRKSPIFFVVYDTKGGPVSLKAGRVAQTPRELVIDNSLAVLYGLRVGDPFVVADFEFRIAGIAENAAALFTAFAFIKYDDMIDFFFESDLVGDISNLPLLSYLLVELKPGADKKVVAEAIESVESAADVFEPRTLSGNDVALGETLFGPVIGVLITSGYLIALLVVGMIMFAAAHSRQRDYGVLKALGFSARSLALALMGESLLVMLLAFPVGVILAELGAWLIETNAPLYRVPIVEIEQLARTLFGVIVLGVLGAFVPYRMVVRLDPGIVFRA